MAKKYNLVGTFGDGISVTGATPGQTVKISAVDENGVPTAWESVDFPSGEELEVIADITLEQVVNDVTINTDLNGNPFALKKVVIEIHSFKENGQWTTFNLLQINGKGKSSFITNSSEATGDSYLWCLGDKPSTVTTETYKAYLFARWEMELNENAVIVGKGRTSTLFEDADGNYHGTNGATGGWNANTENFFVSKDRFVGGITKIFSAMAYSTMNAGTHFVVKGIRM